MMLSVLLLTGCPANPDTGESGLPGDDPDVVDPDDSDAPSPFFEPAALGFAYTGGWDEEQDALLEWAYQGEAYDGYVRIILVTEEFLTLPSDAEARDDEYCELRAFFHNEAGKLDARSQDDDSAASLRAAFTGHLEIYGLLGDRCYSFDPTVWEDGDPRAAFDGMRFGLGIAPMSEYLQQSWTEETLLVYSDYMLAGYMAMNLPDGSGGVEFVARDWTTLVLWQWEVETGEVIVNDQNNLVPQDVTDPVLSGWFQGFPYWYQDLDDIDLDLLTEGVEKE